MQRCLATISFVLSLGATCAWAQSQQVDIPFAFHLGDRTLNAGNYIVTVGQPIQYSFTLVSRTNARDRAISLAFPHGTDGRGASQSKLVFHRYGSEDYFLSQIYAGSSGSMMIKPSKHEKVTSRLIAGHRPETVEILAAVRLP